jgi:hypothetical protein
MYPSSSYKTHTPKILNPLRRESFLLQLTSNREPEHKRLNVFQSRVGLFTNASSFTNAEASFNVNSSQASASSFDTKRRKTEMAKIK